MQEQTLDAMIAEAVEVLSQCQSDACRALVRGLVERWPNAPALSISFALASAAAQITDNFASKGPDVGYRLSALVAADVFALQTMGQPEPKSRDLLHFWRRVDPYFLDL